MVDWQHVAELGGVVLVNVFLGGIALGKIKAAVAELGRRADSADEARDAISCRIDELFKLFAKR